MEDSAGNKRKKKRKPKTTVQDEEFMTCSSCYSKLVKVSDITKVSLNEYKVGGKGNILTCSACGSELRMLNGFVN
ncbi:maturation protein [Goatpox virus]|uniref:Maturation protein n=1 Tax=Goatpox virus TaxID=186805 RepID=A0A5C0PRH8_9POXV|nr:maturation protein [Goatpox virus]QEJ79409.1 maturation protein [Goatpox virus]QEJ79559.1 maturation protein [Goatpox virus]